MNRDFEKIHCFDVLDYVIKVNQIAYERSKIIYRAAHHYMFNTTGVNDVVLEILDRADIGGPDIEACIAVAKNNKEDINQVLLFHAFNLLPKPKRETLVYIADYIYGGLYEDDITSGDCENIGMNEMLELIEGGWALQNGLKLYLDESVQRFLRDMEIFYTVYR